MPFQPPIAFVRFKPWTFGKVQRPNPLGHACFIVFGCPSNHQCFLWFKLRIFGNVQRANTLDHRQLHPCVWMPSPPAMAFVRFEPGTLWNVQCPNPLGHGCFFVWLLFPPPTAFVRFEPWIFGNVQHPNTLGHGCSLLFRSPHHYYHWPSQDSNPELFVLKSLAPYPTRPRLLPCCISITLCSIQHLYTGSIAILNTFITRLSIISINYFS